MNLYMEAWEIPVCLSLPFKTQLNQIQKVLLTEPES